jgi:glucosylceramidase
MPLYFTEGSVFGIGGGIELIQRLRNWASSYNAWVTMLDDNGKPNNGPFPASRATLKLHSQTLMVSENFEFYLYGHFMKFVQHGAQRIQSTEGDRSFNTVAFRNPDGGLVLIAVNARKEPITLRLAWSGAGAEARLGGQSVATFLWREK